MSQETESKYYCPVCQTGFSDEALEKGLAIRRYHEVYCRRHFKEKFPDECLEHPGTPVTTKCSICGRRVCENCYIKLRGKKVCRLCKPAEMAEIVTGQPARRVVRHWWRPVAIGKEIARSLAKRRRNRMIENFYAVESLRAEQQAHVFNVLMGGLMLIIIPIFIPFVIAGYIKYRKKLLKVQRSQIK